MKKLGQISAGSVAYFTIPELALAIESSATVRNSLFPVCFAPACT